MIRTVNEAVDLASEAGLLHVAIPGIPQIGSLAIPNAGFQMQPGSPGTHNPRHGSTNTGRKYWPGWPWRTPVDAGQSIQGERG
jgi:hypothetical protein